MEREPDQGDILIEAWHSRVVFPVYMGVLLWGGLLLRVERLRALIPLRS